MPGKRDAVQTRASALVGHGYLVTTAWTYMHVIADEAEVDYGQLA